MRNYTLTRDSAAAGSCGRTAPYAQRTDAAGSGDARGASTPPRTAAALLSMGHISSPPPPPQLVIWTEGSRADFPAIPDLNPNKPLFRPGSSGSKRGQVTEFTQKSRTRFRRRLATMKRAETAYTMALTLPGSDISGISHEMVMKAFKTLKGRLAAVPRFATVSGFWKRELQQRGAIHYHLILYGLTCPTLRSDFQQWMVRQWNDLMCVNLTEKQKEQHRWWHARSENMEQVRSASYFVKYVGKTDEVGVLTGRWWGAFNQKALPISPKEVIELSPPEAVRLHRLARKRRKKIANEARHRAIAKASGLVRSDGEPIVSQFRLLEAHRLAKIAQKAGSLNDLPPRAAWAAIVVLHPRQSGLRWGKGKRSNPVSQTAPINICSDHAPFFALQALPQSALRPHLFTRERRAEPPKAEREASVFAADGQGLRSTATACPGVRATSRREERTPPPQLFRLTLSDGWG